MEPMNEVGLSLSAKDALIIALPSSARLAEAGDATPDAAHWWRVIDGQITQSGDRLDWLHPSADGPIAAETTVMVLAPAADVALHRARFPGLTMRQAEAAARLLVAERSITPVSALHVATGQAEGDGSSLPVAAVDDRLMALWMAWLSGHGVIADHVVPAALIPPAPPTDTPDAWVPAAVGEELILRSADAAFVAEPGLVAHILGTEGRLVDADSETIDRNLLAALGSVPLDLRSGKWAKAAPALIDRATLRRAAMLVALILLASLAIVVARIIRVHADTAALDSRAAADVASVLRTPPPLEQAIPQLDARLAALGGGTARLSAPYAALVTAMEPSPTVAITALAWRQDGTLSVTLAAPRTEDINSVLLALQARGYTITATPRSGTDGRSLGDITIRSAP